MQLVDVFLKIEERFHLNQAKFEDYEYWNYNRFYIYSYLEERKNGFLTAHEKLGLMNQIWRYLTNMPSGVRLRIERFLRCSKDSNRKILVKCHSRRVPMDGKMVSIYSDLLVDGLDNVINYEPTFLYGHLKPCASANMVYLDAPELSCRIKYCLDRHLLKGRYRALYDEISRRLEVPLSEMERETGVDINKAEIISTVVKHYYSVRELKKFWRKELESNQIAVVIEVVGYSMESMALNAVAHSMNCPVIELQHGTICETHVAYQNLSTEGIATLPDMFFSFGDCWNRQMRMPGIDVISMGFEFFLKERDKYLAKYQKKKQILFISQRNVGQTLSKIAVKLSKLCSDNSEIRIIYKLHPSEFAGARELYPDLFGAENIDVVSNEISLYRLFAESKCQIGFNSTALYEGIGFGLKTYFIDDCDGLIREMVSEGMAEIIDEESNLEEIQKIALSDFGSQINTELVSKLWRDNARENVLDFLKLKGYL